MGNGFTGYVRATALALLAYVGGWRWPFRIHDSQIGGQRMVIIGG
jgi:hypothetical protein